MAKDSVAEDSIPFFFSPFNSIPKRNILFIQDSSIEESLCSFFLSQVVSDDIQILENYKYFYLF